MTMGNLKTLAASSRSAIAIAFAEPLRALRIGQDVVTLIECRFA